MWSMPDKVLKIVAGLLLACCVGGFLLGVAGAPTRGRLPGEAVPGTEGAPMAAAEAQPLNNEELGPPKPPEPIAQIDEEKAEEEDRPPPPPIVKTEPLPIPPPDPIGQILEPTPPPAAAPEDPPF